MSKPKPNTVAEIEIIIRPKQLKSEALKNC